MGRAAALIDRVTEAECEIPLISAVTGHSPKSVQEILSRYLVRTQKLAKLAFQRRLAAEGNGYATDRREEKAECDRPEGTRSQRQDGTLRA
jgi:hypothetical protein